MNGAALAIYSALARLSLDLAPYLEWQSERTQRAPDGTPVRIHVAVDTDVIMMNLAPFDNRQKYGTLFPKHSNDENAGLLVCEIGAFLFDAEARKAIGDNGTRLLLLPPYEIELLEQLALTQRRLQSIKGEEIIDEEAFAAIERDYTRYQSTGDAAQLVNHLRLHAPELVRLYSPVEGALAVIERWKQMPSDSLLPVRSYNWDGGKRLPELDILGSSEARGRHALLVAYWEWLLPRGRYSTTVGNRRDASALAYVEYANSMMDAATDRLVLLTGSRRVLAAARGWLPESSRFDADGDFQRRPPGDDDHEFADRYLSHPFGVLADPRFFGPPGSREIQERVRAETGFDPWNWLSMVLPDAMGESIGLTDRARVRGLLRDVAERHELSSLPGAGTATHAANSESSARHDALELVGNWDRLIQLLAVEEYRLDQEIASRKHATRLLDLIKTLRNKGNWHYADVTDQIEDDISAAVSGLYDRGVWFGLWGSGVSEDMNPLPPIRCPDELPLYRTFGLAERVQRGASAEDRDHQLALLARLRESISTMDPDSGQSAARTRYHTQIGHALVLMSLGLWVSAGAAADLAVSSAASAARDRRSPCPIDGREAAYLASVSFRRGAKSTRDFTLAESYAEYARARQSSPDDSRFTLELLAIKARRAYFAEFYQRKGVPERDLLELLGSFGAVLVETETHNPRGARIRDWILREAYADFFVISLMIREKTPTFVPDAVGSRLIGFDKVMSREAARGVTRAVDRLGPLVLQVATAVFAEGTDDRAAAAQQAEEYIGSYYAGRNRPYDDGRLDLFARLAGLRLDARG